MRKINLLFLILILSSNLKSQDLVRIKHTNYTTTFSKSLKYPVIVEWWDTRKKVGCDNPLPRKDQFAPDPMLPEETDIAKDYVRSGTDRGHMCPAADNECMGDKVLSECFYFSNMAPQYHSLNAGDWKSLETLTRTFTLKYDSIRVWAGSIGVAKKIGSVSVPKQCWKVIYIKRTGEYMAYIFDNNTNKPEGLHAHEIDIDDLTEIIGYRFK